MALSEDITKIREDLTDIKVSIGRMEERDAAQAIDLGEVQTCLYGNGRSGLLEEVTVLKGRVSLIWRILIPSLIAGGGAGVWAGIF